MWRMLTGRADDLRIELLEHEADGERGSAHWLAHYTFSQTGRPVDNDMHASFRFAGRADRRARRRLRPVPLGAPGARRRGHCCWAGRRSLRGAVRRRARAGLDEFMAQERLSCCWSSAGCSAARSSATSSSRCCERMQDDSRREEGCLRYGFFAAVEDPLTLRRRRGVGRPRGARPPLRRSRTCRSSRAACATVGLRAAGGRDPRGRRHEPVPGLFAPPGR